MRMELPGANSGRGDFAWMAAAADPQGDHSAIDAGQYPKGGKVPKAQFDALNIRYDDFRPDWNYSIRPIRTA